MLGTIVRHNRGQYNIMDVSIFLRISCFMKELAYVFGGKVAPGLKREYGKASVSRIGGCNSPLFAGLPEEFIMWMSHGDKLHEVPEGFKSVGKNTFCFSDRSDDVVVGA